MKCFLKCSKVMYFIILLERIIYFLDLERREERLLLFFPPLVVCLRLWRLPPVATLVESSGVSVPVLPVPPLWRRRLRRLRRFPPVKFWRKDIVVKLFVWLLYHTIRKFFLPTFFFLNVFIIILIGLFNERVNERTTKLKNARNRLNKNKIITLWNDLNFL